MSMEYQHFHSAQISIDGKIADHSGGTGIHWSMTEAAFVAPFCLYSGSVRVTSGKVTYTTLLERLMFLFLFFVEDGLANVLR